MSNGDKTGATPTTVLVVDDDSRMRAAMCRVLEEAGYQALQAGYAEDALRTWAKSRDAIDLVITDIVMPGRSGKALAEQLRSDKPEVNILLMSGCRKGEQSARGLSGVAFMRKPFHPTRLLEHVRSLGDANS